MPSCPTCGKHLDPSIRYCPDDGTPLTDTARLGGQPTPAVSADDPTLRVGSVLGERYRLTGHLGGGGMAQVYRAKDNRLARDVAVKIITPRLRRQQEFDARFRREAQIVSRLSDPHIVVLHDYGIDAAHGPFLVMELLEGQSLRHRLNRDGTMPLSQALQLGQQLMLALMHAHSSGVIHRDLKPDNVFLLNQAGMRLHVRVLDFGVSRILDSVEPDGENLTGTGAMIGTPRYMPPEQSAGKTADERSDLYSAALVIYESLTGQLPDHRGLQLRLKCPAAPAELEALLEQCLRSDPDERPISVTEAFLQLHQLAKDCGALLVSESAVTQMTARFRALKATGDVQPLEQPPERNRFTTRRVTAVVATVAALAAVAWWVTRPTVAPGGRESIANVHIGDPRDSLGTAVGKPPLASSVVDPWSSDGSTLRPVLRPDDLGLAPPDLPRLRIMKWSQPALIVILRDDMVRAIVCRGPTDTNLLGIKVGSTDADVRHAFKEPPEIEKFDTPPRAGSADTWGVVWRYPKRGIAFEIYDGKVRAVALYDHSLSPGP